ncbi:MAG: multifunctional acyl-CoA thioesterase and protease and lysophospholipase [Actinomycetia bacterium]|nr:multifunctional acyl-CoA thioesterase and protease and lysophospholipase [Actinomycetes bacterium]
MRASRAAVLAVALLAAGCSGASPAEVVVPAIVRSTPVVPRIDAAMKARLRAVYADGQAKGNQRDVFSKVGDSITAIPDFLVPIGCGRIEWGRWSSLKPVVARWSATTVPRGWELERCGVSNSFTRVGSAAFPGWRAADLLTAHTPHPADCPPPDDVAVRCELRQVKPSVALLEVGTNDMVSGGGQTLDPEGFDRFRGQLRQLIEEILDAGVIPVVSTLPPRRNPPSTEPLPPRWNAEIIRIAADLHVPVWNYWLALQSASQTGMSYDWVHPSPAPTGAGDLRDDAMNWGFNVRNLTALQVLEKVGRVVLDDGRPDT